MNNIELGQVYKVIKGAFTGSEGVLCSGFGNSCYFIKEPNGDRVMVTALQVERVVMETKGQIIKPKAYVHLNDYQYALQQVLNSLSIFIRVDGRKLNVDTYMPLSISQILRIEKLYNIENTINGGNTPYLINIKSILIKGITKSECTLTDIIC
jgi:hypothetical protein